MPEQPDIADLIERIADPSNDAIATDPEAKEQFRAQLIKLIDERIALAAQSAVRSGVAYRLHGEGAGGMADVRKGV